ncbi:hypothetical protein ACJX0J_031454, partial [Zea mays]
FGPSSLICLLVPLLTIQCSVLKVQSTWTFSWCNQKQYPRYSSCTSTKFSHVFCLTRRRKQEQGRRRRETQLQLMTSPCVHCD